MSFWLGLFCTGLFVSAFLGEAFSKEAFLLGGHFGVIPIWPSKCGVSKNEHCLWPQFSTLKMGMFGKKLEINMLRFDEDMLVNPTSYGILESVA